MSPKERAEKKDQNRELVLHHLYEIVDGDARHSCAAPDFYKSLANTGIPGDDADEAYAWLLYKRLIECKFAGHLGLTQLGVEVVERMDKDRSEGKAPTAQPVSNNVNNFFGPVGGVQTGSNNTMNVAQQVNGASTSDIAVFLEQLRAGIATLPEESRREATEVLTEFEKQATSEKPSKALVKSYAASLNEYLLAYAPVIATIVELCAKKLGG